MSLLVGIGSILRRSVTSTMVGIALVVLGVIAFLAAATNPLLETSVIDLNGSVGRHG